MSIQAAAKTKNEQQNKLIVQRIVQIFSVLGIQAVLLFASAGSVRWGWGWMLLIVYVLSIAGNGILMFRYNREAVAERAKAAGQKDWDKWISGLWGLTYYILTLLIAGLDWRFAWSKLHSILPNLAGLILFAGGLALFSWAMIANAYFATVSRIQSERGQMVCSSGPYRFVRHPGYVGAILQSIGAPLLLGSLWGLVPGVLAALLMILRTFFEDRMLQTELPGYPEYSQRVRYRLLPGIW
jgi:protein-S-isoprenylcysteine O-methyltransferase Ste14